MPRQARPRRLLSTQLRVTQSQRNRQAQVQETVDREAHCAADCVPIGLPRMVMPSGNGRAATLKPRSTSSLRSRR